MFILINPSITNIEIDIMSPITPITLPPLITPKPVFKDI